LPRRGCAPSSLADLGQADARARYDLPSDQIERYVAGFIAAVSSA
jgi:hypothetical protein